jgi:hypothetical protein
LAGNSVLRLIGAALLVLFVSGCGEKAEERSTRISKDGKGVASVKRVGDREYVVRDGKEASAGYEAVRSPIILPDGGTAYAARTGKGWSVKKQGETVGIGYDHVAGLTPGPENSVVYAAKSGSKWQVMKDGEPLGARYESVSSPTVSEDGEVAYAAREEGKAYVVKNGERLPGEYDWTWKPEFVTGGKSLGYVVATPQGCRVMRDGEPVSAPYEAIRAWGISPDGRSVALIAVQKGEFYLFHDDRRVGPAIGPVEEFSRPAFSADNRSVVFAIGGGRSRFFWRDGARHGKPFQAEGVGRLLLRPDGGAVACSAVLGGKWFIVKDGIRVGETYDKISRLRNGPDGKTLRFTGVRGGRTIQVDVAW